MNTRTLSAGLASVALISLALGCEKGTPASAMLASKPTALSPNFSASASNHHMRWDILSVNFGTRTASAGGIASAQANDGSEITITGSGTFRSDPGNPQDVTGGGGWGTHASRGAGARSGTHEGARLLSYVLAPRPVSFPDDQNREPPTGPAGPP